jgi:hypothetical protein
MTCTHEGFHSGEGRYDRRAGTLRYVMVCDDCHEEVAQIQVQEYSPAFLPGARAQQPPGTGARSRPAGGTGAA